MNKTTFTSRGYTYELFLKPRDFALKYFENCDSLSDSRILEFLVAECRPQKGLFKVRPTEPEHFIFWFEEDAKEEDMMYLCLDSIDAVTSGEEEDKEDLTVLSMYDWAIDIKNTFQEIKKNNG